MADLHSPLPSAIVAHLDKLQSWQFYKPHLKNNQSPDPHSHPPTWCHSTHICQVFLHQSFRTLNGRSVHRNHHHNLLQPTTPYHQTPQEYKLLVSISTPPSYSASCFLILLRSYHNVSSIHHRSCPTSSSSAIICCHSHIYYHSENHGRGRFGCY